MIKITTDSTCDLPAALLERYGVEVFPLGVVKGGALFRDGESITTADIAAHVDGGGDITTTNAVSIGDYEERFRVLSAQCEAVIHINIGPDFSCCHQNALAASEELSNIHVVSSENLSVGHGFLVLAAAEAAEAGKSPEEILTLLEGLVPRLEMSFVLDRLDYMKKGGRCSSVTALGANLLKLHPCIEVLGGKMSVVKKYRGSIERVVQDYLRDRLGERTDLDVRRAILVDTCQDDHLAAVAREFLERDGRFGEVLETKAGCTIFSHCGPGTLGILLLRK